VAGKLFGKLTASELNQLKSASTKLRDAAVAALVKKPAFRGWSMP
jgi:stalled ribosome alternative rescue factor ArfA